jgi:hypothetical protein
VSERPRDEDDLQAFLDGKSALSRRYEEEAKDEQPPAHVDSAILAASRWAVGADNNRAARRRAAPWWRRLRFVQWSVPLAMAAVVGLAVTLTLTIERDPELDRIYQRHDAALSESETGANDREPAAVAMAPQVGEAKPSPEAKEAAGTAPRKAAQPQVPVEQEKSPAKKSASPSASPAPPSGALGLDDDTGKSEAGASALMADMARPQEAPEKRAVTPLAERQRSDADGPAVGSAAQTAVAPSPGRESENLAPETAAVESPAFEEMVSAQEVAPADEQIAASRPAAEADFADAPAEPVAPAPRAAGQTQRDPAQWIADIEEQLDRGNIELARAAVKNFRSRYPDYELPQRLADLLPESGQ